jgi:SagB-type dehydrogenase family enzyme
MSAEDADPALAQWEFHDLLFHSRSRPGPHDYPVGGTYPFLGRIPPLPALKPEMRGEGVPLAIPDLSKIEKQDVSLDLVMNRRKSVRTYGAEPMTAAQLGEFLYRVARVQNIFEKNPAQLRYYQSSRRPYPSGGAAYDLEVYIVVHRCAGLARGLYHYDPLNHQLRKLAGRDACLDALLAHAQGAAVLQAKPQVLIVLTSRFQRLSWKYRGLAYATTLKNVGVLFQTMYLVATAMQLAPCALGTGNSSLFAEALGIEFFVESSVGEFVLGSLP